MKKYRTNTQIILVILIFFLFFIHIPVYAYSPHVFKIESNDCSLCPEKRDHHQTGFTIQGKLGIITALHGVAGRNSIRAHQDIDGGQFFNGLKIAFVNIEHDLALLSSNELNGKIAGFEISGEKSDYTEIKCISYPFGLPSQIPITGLTVHLPPKELWTLLTTDGLRANIEKRKSPILKLKVLYIQGQIHPGSSGAPILNKRNQVVGVANGGLQMGSAISWAIPYNNEIIWTPFSDKKNEINRLAKLPESALFAFSTFQTPDGELITWQEPRAGTLMTWIEARKYVNAMNRKSFKGHSDWRLPAVGELQDLAQFIKSNPGSYSGVNKLYWSSEQFGVFEAMAVNLGNVRMGRNDLDKQIRQRSKEKRLAVRLVRSLVE